jgi:hypothetical protein
LGFARDKKQSDDNNNDGDEQSGGDDDERPAFRAVSYEEFLPGYEATMRKTMTPLWLADNRNLKRWLVVNGSSRGHGGYFRLPLLLALTRSMSSSSPQLKRKELVQGAEYAFTALAQSFSEGNLSSLKGNAAPLLRSAIDVYEEVLRMTGTTVNLDFKSVESVELVGIAGLYSLPTLTSDRLVSTVSKAYFDEALLQRMEESRKNGKLSKVMDEIVNTHFSAVYWAKIVSNERLSVLDKNGTVIAESPKGGQEHLWKFQLDLPPAEERFDPQYEGGTWKLVDMDLYSALRLRAEVMRSKTRIRPSENFAISAVWGSMIDIS